MIHHDRSWYEMEVKHCSIVHHVESGHDTCIPWHIFLSDESVSFYIPPCGYIANKWWHSNVCRTFPLHVSNRAQICQRIIMASLQPWNLFGKTTKAACLPSSDFHRLSLSLKLDVSVAHLSIRRIPIGATSFTASRLASHCSNLFCLWLHEQNKH